MIIIDKNLVEKIAQEQIIRFSKLGFKLIDLKEFTFQIKHTKSVAGTCCYTNKTIGISDLCIANQTIEGLKNTIAHEMLHAITPNSGHGIKWQRLADTYNESYKDTGVIEQKYNKLQAINSLPEFEKEEILKTSFKYALTCPKCGYKSYRQRKNGIYTHAECDCSMEWIEL